MKQFKYKITDPLGIHARPAGMLARIAKNHEAVCVLHAHGKSARLTQLIQLMGLGIKRDDEITVTAEGADEEAAIQALSEFIQTNL